MGKGLLQWTAQKSFILGSVYMGLSPGAPTERDCITAHSAHFFLLIALSEEALRTKELNRLTFTGYGEGRTHYLKVSGCMSLSVPSSPIFKAHPLSHCFFYLMQFSISEEKHQLIWRAQSYPSEDSSCCKPPKHLPKPKQHLLLGHFFFPKIAANNSLLFLGKLANSSPTASALPKSSLCSIVLKHTDFFPYYWSQEPCSANCMKIMSQIKAGTSFF